MVRAAKRRRSSIFRQTENGSSLSNAHQVLATTSCSNRAAGCIERVSLTYLVVYQAVAALAASVTPLARFGILTLIHDEIEQPRIRVFVLAA